MKQTETLREESPVVWNRNEFSVSSVLDSEVSAVQYGKNYTSVMSVMRWCLSPQVVSCAETNRVTENILEAWACCVISCCGQEENDKLGYAVREFSCLSQPPFLFLVYHLKKCQLCPLDSVSHFLFTTHPHASLFLLIKLCLSVCSCLQNLLSPHLISLQSEQLLLPSNSVDLSLWKNN